MIRNFLYKLLRKHNLQRWRDFLAIPRSQIRICMFLLQHGNKMAKHDLINGLIEIGYSDNRQSIKTIIYRALTDHILIEKNGYISVVNPSYFVIKIIRGNIFDNWKTLVIPTSILAVLFYDINPLLSKLFLVATFLSVIGWLIDDWFHTLRY